MAFLRERAPFLCFPVTIPGPDPAHGLAREEPERLTTFPTPPALKRLLRDCRDHTGFRLPSDVPNCVLCRGEPTRDLPGAVLPTSRSVLPSTGMVCFKVGYR